MVLVETFGDDEVFLHCHGEELSLWQNFLLLIWSIAIFCVKAAQFIQSFIHTWLVQSLKHPSSSLTPTKNSTQPTQVTLNQGFKFAPPNLKVFCCLFFRTMVIDHIIPKLSKIPLILWHLQWMNKSWCVVVGKNVAWNALKIKNS
jgi:hypothetical protein